jgi:hypothetical protein
MAATLVVATLLTAALPGSAAHDLARAEARGTGDGAASQRCPRMAVVMFALLAAALLGSGLGAGSRTWRAQQLGGVGEGAAGRCLGGARAWWLRCSPPRYPGARRRTWHAQELAGAASRRCPGMPAMLAAVLPGVQCRTWRGTAHRCRWPWRLGAQPGLRMGSLQPSIRRKSENGWWVGEERKEEGDDRSGPHISQVVAGAFQAIRKYVALRVGPKASNTYKMV